MSDNINVKSGLTDSSGFEKLNKSQLEHAVNSHNENSKFKVGTDYPSSHTSFKRDNTENLVTESFRAQSIEGYVKVTGDSDELLKDSGRIVHESAVNTGSSSSDAVDDKGEHLVADTPPSPEVERLKGRIVELEKQIAARQHTEKELENVLNLLNSLSDDLRPIAKITSDTIHQKLWDLLDELIIERVGTVIDLNSDGFQTKLLKRIRELHMLDTTLRIKLNADDLETIRQNSRENLNFDSYIFDSDPSLRRSEFIIENSSFQVEDKLIKPHLEDESDDV